MKKLNIFFIPLIFFGFAASAQQFIDIQLSPINKGREMILNWEYQLAGNEDYFLVEKLDAQWNYEMIDTVFFASGTDYSIVDANPSAGENYYRVTLRKADGQTLLSDLLIADYFPPQEATFEILFNDSIKHQMLADLEIVSPKAVTFASYKYAQSTMKLQRLRVTEIVEQEILSSKYALAGL